MIHDSNPPWNWLTLMKCVLFSLCHAMLYCLPPPLQASLAAVCARRFCKLFLNHVWLTIEICGLRLSCLSGIPNAFRINLESIIQHTACFPDV